MKLKLPELPQRYVVVNKSVSAHCCFGYTVWDTTKPDGYRDESGPHYKTVCECFDVQSAELVATALNTMVANNVEPN